MNKLTIEYLPLEDLKPYANNAKIHTEEQIQQIRKSIEEFGMNDPIAIWKDNEIIEGHGRLLACQQMGLQEVPVIRLDGLTDEQRRAYMNVHNNLTMNTGFDFEILKEELARIENIDMGQFGFDIEDFLGETDPEVEEDDYQEPEKMPARAKEGQRFQLGEHILMCGDSTKPEDVEKLTGGGFLHRPLCDGSAIQRQPRNRGRACAAAIGSEAAAPEDRRAGNSKRQLGQRRRLYTVFDFSVPEHGDSITTRRRVLYLVRKQ